MKKWIGLLLAGILVSSALVGCQKNEETETPPADTAGATAGATAGEGGTTA